MKVRRLFFSSTLLLAASAFALGCVDSGGSIKVGSPSGEPITGGGAGSGGTEPPGSPVSQDMALAPWSPPDLAGAPADAAGPAADLAPSAPACGSTPSLALLIAQKGSGDTHSTVTPMGTNFVSSFNKLPLSSAMSTFLATASSNPTLAQATVATGLIWHSTKVTLYPSGTPSPEDVMQHAIGDCDGDAAMASLAYVNPGFVMSLITDNKDGTFSVKMFDPAGKPIKVNVDSQMLVEANDTTYPGSVSGSSLQATWSTILEKAVMKYDVAYGTPWGTDGIGSEFMLPMFTGNGDSIAFSPGSLTAEQLQEVVTTSLAAGKFITGGFNQEVSLGNNQTITAHGYTMIVPTNPTKDLVDMRNPWGVNPWATGSNQSGYDTSTDGLLEIPMSTVANNWPQIVDLRIIDPGADCAGVTTPFVPQPQKLPADRIHIRDSHAQRSLR